MSLARAILAEAAIRENGPGAMLGDQPAVVVLALAQHGDLVRAQVGASLVRTLKLPKLTIRSTQKYISAVARAVELGQLAKGDANSLLYAAQMLLAAHRYHMDTLPPEQTDVQAKRLGFVQAFADDHPACKGGTQGGNRAGRKAVKQKTKTGFSRSRTILELSKCLQR